MPANKKIKGLTVEIGGDTTSLGKALDSSKKNSQSLQKELREVNRLLKGNPDDIELLSQKETILKKRVEETAKQLDLLKGSQEKINKLYENGEIGEEDYRAFQREIERTQQTLNGLQTDLNNTSEHFGRVQRSSEDFNFKNAENKVDYLKGKFKDFAEDSAKNLKKVSDKMNKVGSGIETAGQKLTPVSAGAAGLLGAGVKLASDFEDAMAKVSTIADTSQKPIDELRREIINLSNETGVDASEIANNVYDAISAGQDTADAVNFVKNAISLAKAGFADTGASLDVLTTILNAYGLEAKEVTNVSDTLIQTQNLGKTTVAQLAASMGKIIPTANSYGVNLQQVAAGYAVMTSNGVATAESTTYMNSMLNELGKSGTKASKILKEQTGKSFSELMSEGKSLSDVLKIVSDAADKDGKKFNDMWGSAEAAKAGTILLGDGVGKFNGVLDKMGKSSGSTSTALGKLETTSTKTKKTVNELKNVGIELGSEVLEQAQPLLKDLMGGAKELTKWLGSLNDEQKQTLVKGIELIAVLGPGTTAVGKLTKNVGNIVAIIPKVITGITSMTTATEGAAAAQEGLNLAQSLSPAGALITLITGLVAVMGALYFVNKDNIESSNLLAGSYSSLWKEIDENKRAYDEMKKARDSAISDVSAEFGYYDELREKLDKIVDKSGKVKKGHEEEADTIINTLSKALDIEIEKRDGVIKNYKDLQNELKKTIELKKAEAIQSVYSDSYSEAIKGQTKAYTDYQEAVKSAQEAQNNLINAREKLKRMPAAGHYEQTTTGRVWKEDKQAALAYEQQKVLIKSYTNAVEEANKKVQNQQSIYLGYMNTISEYESLTAALASGNQKEIEAATLLLENSFITAKNGTREMLEQQVTDLQQKYESMKAAVESGAPGVTQSMVDNAKSMVEQAENELKKLPQDTTAAIEETKTAVETGSDNVKNSWNTKLSEQLSEFTGKKVEFQNAGRGQVQMYIDGVAEKEPIAKSEMSRIVNGVIKKIKDKNADTKRAAEYLLDGFDDGIQNPDKQKSIFDHIGTFGNLIITTFKAIFHIKSPSKVTKEIGKYLVMGLSDGMAENAGDAVRQAETVSKRVVNGFEKAAVSKRILITKASSGLAEAVSSELRDGLRNSSVIETQSRIIIENRFAQPDRQATQLGEVLSKLDTLTKTVEKTAQKDIRLNDGTLVGSTAKKYDSALGEIAAKRERGW